jgi:hypothetical protein
VTTAIALGLPALLAEGLRPRDLRRATQRAVIPPDRPRPPSKPRPGSPPADRAAGAPGS